MYHPTTHRAREENKISEKVTVTNMQGINMELPYAGTQFSAAQALSVYPF